MMWKYKFEYVLARIIGIIAKSISLKTALHIGDVLGDLFFYIIKIRKVVALNNLRLVFGSEKSEKELKQILRLTYRHFGRMMMEFARIPILTREKLAQEVVIHDRHHLEELLAQNKGVIVISAHFGNWEYLAGALAQIHPPMYAVFKPQKNKAIDRIIKQYRENIDIVPLQIKGGAAKGVVKAVRQKALALIVFDQDAGKKGVFIDFFGKPASTNMGPAMIAIRTRTPVIMAFGIRGKNGMVQIHLQPFTDINLFSNDEQGILQFISEYNTILENYIRKFPEQYLWMHKRWRSKPAVDRL